ncbi:conjugal transfer protein [Porphyromonas macacae]|uniref:Conjugal transfer protein n=1 Tax=Porphyromonas macacae TaxID=28115 RepID=A0A0A2EFM8_9PORP|nr:MULTISPECIES: conjugative transposon protein TraM [Porphyromonas]KGL51722.1 conjugal transfer protein [Porphyromonas canoris]KGL56619.1 conjugal transfer protein [Porphyromonas sp. COT-052 OH4946]KGN76402.1 conjugal transfer protein [Porphyromonas macacae]KKC51368.1 conjugal transfer protein [Porphyromonas gulae]
MEQNQNLNQETSNNKERKEKKQLSPQELQKRKKLIIFPLMFLAFAGCMWLIFAPSSKDEVKPDEIGGFNADIPLPKEDGIYSDKKTAYEQESMKSKQEDRMRSLQDFGFTLGEENKVTDNLSLTADLPEEQPARNNRSYYGGSSRNSSYVQSSAYAYQDINRQLGSFYETPKEDPEKEELARKIEELESRLYERENTQSTADEQLALLEKSYELAAKYMNGGQEQAVKQVTPTASIQGKVQALPVQAVTEQTVSGLQVPMSDAEFIAAYSQPRNFGFNTAVGTESLMGKNTILACIHEDQSVMDGQNVRLRLLEPLQAGHIRMPKNSLLSGTARVQGERMDINISSLEYEGNIIPVELVVYDSDGQKGLSVPSSLEMQALNEGMANIGAGLGSSFTVNQNAGAAIVSDLTRGVLQGGSQYLSKKFRTVKVNLKADYKVMLYTKQ